MFEFLCSWLSNSSFLDILLQNGHNDYCRYEIIILSGKI